LPREEALFYNRPGRVTSADGFDHHASVRCGAYRPREVLGDAIVLIVRRGALQRVVCVSDDQGLARGHGSGGNRGVNPLEVGATGQGQGKGKYNQASHLKLLSL